MVQLLRWQYCSYPILFVLDMTTLFYNLTFVCIYLEIKDYIMIN